MNEIWVPALVATPMDATVLRPDIPLPHGAEMWRAAAGWYIGATLMATRLFAWVRDCMAFLT